MDGREKGSQQVMEKILDIITSKMQQAFADAGYDAAFGRVTVSNRPDLCE